MEVISEDIYVEGKDVVDVSRNINIGKRMKMFMSGKYRNEVIDK
jgi:hypothetical protein